jgi:hypothetical protein
MRAPLGIVLVACLSLGGVPTGRACASVEKSCCCPIADETAPPPERRVEGACCCLSAPAGAAVVRRTEIESPRVERAVSVLVAHVVAPPVSVCFVSPPAARQTSPPKTLVSARILLLC